MKKRNTGVSLHLVLSITLLLFISALMGFTIHLVRIKLLQNTQQLGMALVKSYALEEESQINSFRSALEMGALYVDVLQSTNSSPETIQEWLIKYFDKVTDTFGPGSVDSYAVIDGKIIAANPWEGGGSFNFSQRAWYTDALASAGEVVRRIYRQYHRRAGHHRFQGASKGRRRVCHGCLPGQPGTAHQRQFFA